MFYGGQTADFPWAKQPTQGSFFFGRNHQCVSQEKCWLQLNFCATLLINNQFQHCRIYHLSMHQQPASASGVRLLVMWIHSFYFPLLPFGSSFFYIFFPEKYFTNNIKSRSLSFCVSALFSLTQTTSNVSFPHPSDLYLPSRFLSFLCFNVCKIYCALRFATLALMQGSPAVMFAM